MGWWKRFAGEGKSHWQTVSGSHRPELPVRITAFKALAVRSVWPRLGQITLPLDAHPLWKVRSEPTHSIKYSN
jgi:hypothetical protein